MEKRLKMSDDVIFQWLMVGLSISVGVINAAAITNLFKAGTRRTHYVLISIFALGFYFVTWLLIVSSRSA